MGTQHSQKNFRQRLADMALAVTISSFGLVTLSWAAFPNTSSQPVSSFESLPVLKCPAIPSHGAQLLTDLRNLKNTVKKDAQCENESNQIKDLEKLIGDNRIKVMKAIEKSKTQQLTEAELDEIKNYAETVTGQVASIIDLIGNNGSSECFDEDQKGFDLGSLSKIILDASKIMQTVGGGVWNAPLTVGSQVVAGFLKGMDAVVKKRKGYRFNEPKQRQSFVNALCSYYDYRLAVGKYLNPQQEIYRLRDLSQKLNDHLQRLGDKCEKCFELGSIYINQPNMTAQIANSAPFQNARTLMNSIDRSYDKPLGSFTIRGLITQVWLEREIARLEDANEPGSTIDQEMLSTLLIDFDKFFFEKEGPRLVNWLAAEALDKYAAFRVDVIIEGRRLLYQKMILERSAKNSGIVFDDPTPLNEGQLLDKVAALANSGPLTQGTAQIQKAHRLLIEEAKSNLKSLLQKYDDVVRRYNVLATQCDFYRKSNSFFKDLKFACEYGRSERVRSEILKIKFEAKKTQERIYEPNHDQAVGVDWVDALTHFLDNSNKDPLFINLLH